ncbi:TusE/DsrC/DsvC family sulfur relay protein [Varunaivibrio sulfuroxidans]|uniref:tRNA 2-thiouridine synthesizing protein E n=1 Tax=Varunaivibrio sulfuroxidans TaxID=1773489 RepID=A0A4R3J777_9PROT|nr:TusE/DsrC/DsvC family sulfur relay protein [Varunaivibrio sulfuroxidans]TCS61205.1 tRNA 2-thiouridine synthesizing protein E [Varunaivibrio sulfuroxidans]WES31174.1 TusE/DsrC/DsvC family sulfur relay protein [Varunaivibrio sulfuroxidans]
MQQTSEMNVAFGDEGYLINPNDWTEDVAAALAEDEGIELTEEHWTVLRFMRDWYTEHGVAPSGRDVGLFMKKIGAPRNRLFELFPYGYVQQACKIAGMIKPRSWSTG